MSHETIIKDSEEVFNTHVNPIISGLSTNVQLETSQHFTFNAINIAMIQRNWLLGRRICEEELQGESRAEYGSKIINKLSKDLTDFYGKGFTKTNLYLFAEFYKSFPNIFHALSGKSLPMLSWTHYRTLLQVDDKDARDWYLKESAEQMPCYTPSIILRTKRLGLLRG